MGTDRVARTGISGFKRSCGGKEKDAGGLTFGRAKAIFKQKDKSGRRWRLLFRTLSTAITPLVQWLAN
jgi:hypothetical protein